MVACGTRKHGVELWQVGRRNRGRSSVAAPELFARVPTPPAPSFVHVLSSPRGVDSWPPSKSLAKSCAAASAVAKSLPSSNIDDSTANPSSIPSATARARDPHFFGPLLAVIPSHTAHNYSCHEVRVYSILNKQCVRVLRFPDALPKSVRSNGSVVIVHAGSAVHVFSTKTLKHLHVFSCELGARGSPAVAFGVRLLAVPSHGNHTLTSSHRKTAAPAFKVTSTLAASNAKDVYSKSKGDPSDGDATPDPALQGSMSTADWSAVDVAKGVDNSISIGTSSYLHR